MSRLILTRGIPASGKSTWAKAWAAGSPTVRLRVNRDNLRHTLGVTSGVGTSDQENEVSYWEKQMTLRAINQGKDVVIDATNLNSKFVKDWIKFAHKNGAGIEFKDFPIDRRAAVARDKIRELKGERFVGYVVIDSFLSRYHIDPITGELPKAPSVELSAPVVLEPYVGNPQLPHAILCDLDGTLANIDHRSPYDETKYHLDGFNYDINRILDYYSYGSGCAVILMSGRKESAREATEKWLEIHGVIYDALYMRATDDNRNDAIVKNELFEKHVSGGFNVDFILDDRERVVEMWRAKGLRVLQVAPGNF